MLFAKHFHVEVTVGFDPILMDFDRQRPDESQHALLAGKDANDMLDLLIEPLKHIGAFTMFVVFSGQPIKGQSFSRMSSILMRLRESRTGRNLAGQALTVTAMTLTRLPAQGLTGRAVARGAWASEFECLQDL